MVDQMLQGKPERYKSMVIERLNKANEYSLLANGRIVSRQVIAIVMLMVDEIYVENTKGN